MIGLDFERPILELERKIEELRHITKDKEVIKRLEQELEKKKNEIYQNLTAWQRVKIARHPRRPYTLDYIDLMLTDFCELHGDRLFSDDKAMVSGLAKLDGQKILVLGHQKGRDTKENLKRNFGCAHPEGYRKALRLMQLAQKFNVPIVTLIDTPGAYPGIGAEERGQAQAIALNLREMVLIGVPIVVVVIGEGGSGGALGIGIGDRVCVMENAYYSVISPEGCAAILWKDSAKANEAASALKLTAQELLELGIIDDIVNEPQGGAHRDAQKTAQSLKKTIKKHLDELKQIPVDILLAQRYQKFRKIGVFA
ncbi:MAG: acetyl-CoA carboxylase carboxyltransferase subunit alpha [Omnitrophica WOR_2 bacterium GWF2_43_52]|nr:MAG: acetyl-CoA carboxylase carboxyltransferase subunit alpha [Omnitrophica WOR_2 bacterium GWC2_44_8]OGX21576.1 MAG: acetyl-CoA carboxylase carboxyltransferase subunit alpha [Omnitrophica WOR_2 bacterium GWF2_43_52]HAH19462.1 acetyl-CoA carboxylase carboxyl transferase subunit alpha [Candidatus Omnitrophota bacterium]HBG63833.1 acetyl-CoA carboxylase carboxyl transferase subunit alpha [Candidatus Omnitrophota bacterium]HCD38817.1 acetyl-CoA carboxylase carboxyl transferase subunit alpha [Ca